ncbi:MAG: hypothetical protein KG075_07610 [Alphaproteobacteria bacterium]|nr:hypothetical protein [Alphaproteobacteria bacterium]
MPDVALHIDGAIYRFWKSVKIHRGLDELSGSFELSVTDPYTAKGGRLATSPIKRGSSCKVAIEGETVITGFVDDVDPGFDDANHTITVRGRDHTGDLVDSSAINRPGEWSGLTLDRIASTICQPFGIPVRAQTDMGKPFDRFALQQAETAHAAIDRACKQRGVMSMADGLGGLLLCRAGTARHGVMLEEGKNMKSGDGKLSMRGRHSEYIVIGQQPGFEGGSATDFAHGVGRAKDPGVTRYRPLVIVAEDVGGIEHLQDRATWEANTRLGKGDAVTVTAMGWRENGLTGPLWKPNHCVLVRSPLLRYDGELLIKSVDYVQNDKDGTIAEIALVRKEAYELLATPVVKGLVW